MALILAIEPDAAQAATLRQVIREQVAADLVLVSSKTAAVSALEDGVPDLILVSALLPPHEEDELVAHLQTLTIPQLTALKKGRARKKGPARTKRSFFTRHAASENVAGCEPTEFASKVATYLKRALEPKADLAPAVAPTSVDSQADARSVEPLSRDIIADLTDLLVPSSRPQAAVKPKPLVSPAAGPGKETTRPAAQWPVVPTSQPPVAVKPESLVTSTVAEQREEELRQETPRSVARRRGDTPFSSLASTFRKHLSHLFVAKTGASSESEEVPGVTEAVQSGSEEVGQANQQPAAPQQPAPEALVSRSRTNYRSHCAWARKPARACPLKLKKTPRGQRGRRSRATGERGRLAARAHPSFRASPR